MRSFYWTLDKRQEIYKLLIINKLVYFKCSLGTCLLSFVQHEIIDFNVNALLKCLKSSFGEREFYIFVFEATFLHEERFQ